MKKTLLALAAIAGISMLFMGCPHSTKTPASPVSDPVIDNSGDDTPVEESGYSIDFRDRKSVV